jgi:hypothetical protein
LSIGFGEDQPGARVNTMGKKEWANRQVPLISPQEFCRIHVSGALQKELADAFVFTPRVVVAVKGLGELETFFLERRGARLPGPLPTGEPNAHR